MRIFLIAPQHDDLPDVDTEIAAINASHVCVNMTGVVRDQDIAAKLREEIDRNGNFDVIWWATHGSRDGVLLSDGPLDIEGVAQYTCTSGAKLCVLNTCDSELIAHRVGVQCKTDVVYTITTAEQRGVQNLLAIRFGMLLAGELAYTDDPKIAYDVVAPAGGIYRYYDVDVGAVRRSFTNAVSFGELVEMEKRAYADRLRIQAGMIILTLIVLFGGVGLFRELNTIQQNQEEILNSLNQIEERIIRVQLGRNYDTTPPWLQGER